MSLQKIRLTKTTIRSSLENHPNYPSLFSIADCLAGWNIDNYPARADIDMLSDLPTPFITWYRNQFYLVRSVTSATVTCFNGLDNVQIEKLKFTAHFSGIVLLAQRRADSGEPDYSTKRRREFFKAMATPLIFCTGLFTILGWTVAAAAHDAGPTTSYQGISLLLNWIGVWTTASLLWYEVDKNNGFIQKICAGREKVNCTAVLSSRSARAIGPISWSEVGFFYFAGCMLTLLYGHRLCWLVGLVNIAAFPYVFYSVYIQWRKVRHWCLLCLVVQALLAIGFAMTLLDWSALRLNSASWTSIAAALPTMLPLSLLPIALWYFLKPFLKAEAALRERDKELRKFKFNQEIFQTLLSRQKQVEQPSPELGIILGDPSADRTLIKVCNPYCGPCAKAHPDVEELLRTTENLKVQIIFNATNKDGDKLAPPVKHFLAIDEKGDKSLTTKALDDWYNAQTKDYEKFAALHPVDDSRLSIQSRKLERMSKWCDDISLEYTPTYFYCGYQLPQPYNVRDLSSFI